MFYRIRANMKHFKPRNCCAKGFLAQINVWCASAKARPLKVYYLRTSQDLKSFINQP